MQWVRPSAPALCSQDALLGILFLNAVTHWVRHSGSFGSVFVVPAVKRPTPRFWRIPRRNRHPGEGRGPDFPLSAGLDSGLRRNDLESLRPGIATMDVETYP